MRHRHSHLRAIYRAVAGTLLGAAMALASARYFVGRPHRLIVPVLFIAVLILIGARFGTAAAILASVASALIFARVLYDPPGSFAVSNEGARASLGWMLLGGIVPAYLLGTKARDDGPASGRQPANEIPGEQSADLRRASNQS